MKRAEGGIAELDGFRLLLSEGLVTFSCANPDDRMVFTLGQAKLLARMFEREAPRVAQALNEAVLVAKDYSAHRNNLAGPFHDEEPFNVRLSRKEKKGAFGPSDDTARVTPLRSRDDSSVGRAYPAPTPVREEAASGLAQESEPGLTSGA